MRTYEAIQKELDYCEEQLVARKRQVEVNAKFVIEYKAKIELLKWILISS